MVTLTVYQTKTNREKIVGLIGKTKPYPLLLCTRFGIHTFGVRFPIDVIIVNSEHTIMDICESMKPNRVFLWNPRFSLVLELPAGTIAREKLTKGTRIKLVVK